MAKAQTRKRLLDAAETLFAEHGYAGASIRRITKEAAVDLGSVRYHFGSKDGLLGEVMRRRLEPLCRERMERLDALAATPADPCRLEQIIEAYVVPVVKLVSHESHGGAWTKLLARVRVEPGRYLAFVQDVYDRLVQHYLAAFREQLPELPEEELVYRIYFLFGTVVNTLIDDGSLRAIGRGILEDDVGPDAVVRALIRFVAGGMRAPATGPHPRPRSRGRSGARSAPGLA